MKLQSGRTLEKKAAVLVCRSLYLGVPVSVFLFIFIVCVCDCVSECLECFQMEAWLINRSSW